MQNTILEFFFVCLFFSWARWPCPPLIRVYSEWTKCRVSTKSYVTGTENASEELGCRRVDGQWWYQTGDRFGGERTFRRVRVTMIIICARRDQPTGEPRADGGTEENDGSPAVREVRLRNRRTSRAATPQPRRPPHATTERCEILPRVILRWFFFFFFPFFFSFYACPLPRRRHPATLQNYRTEGKRTPLRAQWSFSHSLYVYIYIFIYKCMCIYILYTVSRNNIGGRVLKRVLVQR